MTLSWLVNKSCENNLCKDPKDFILIIKNIKDSILAPIFLH